MSTGFDHEERAQIGRIRCCPLVAAAVRQCQKLYPTRKSIVFDNY